MHKFDPHHIDRLLSEERSKEIAPEALLRDSGLSPGHVFADIGCGPGSFTFPASSIVGARGKVYAIDTQEEMLSILRKRNPPSNCVILKSEENRIPLEDSSVDLALLGYMLHEAEDKNVFLKEVRRILKGEGILLVLDWKKISEDKGPPMEERLSEDTVKGLLKDAGFGGIKVSSLTGSHYRITASVLFKRAMEAPYGT